MVVEHSKSNGLVIKEAIFLNYLLLSLPKNCDIFDFFDFLEFLKKKNQKVQKIQIKLRNALKLSRNVKGQTSRGQLWNYDRKKSNHPKERRLQR